MARTELEVPARDPDNIKRLARSLVERLTPDQEDMGLNPRRRVRTW